MLSATLEKIGQRPIDAVIAGDSEFASIGHAWYFAARERDGVLGDVKTGTDRTGLHPSLSSWDASR
jgi:hypothetical protein